MYKYYTHINNGAGSLSVFFFSATLSEDRKLTKVKMFVKTFVMTISLLSLITLLLTN